MSENPVYALRSDAGREGKAKTPSPDAKGKVRLRDPGFTVEEERSPTLDGGSAHIVAAPLTAGGHPNSNTPGRRRENDVNLVAHTLNSGGADAGEDGTGRGTPLTVAPMLGGATMDRATSMRGCR